MAPTTYGFSTNNQPTDHDLISKLFLEALLDGTPGTTGDKWRKAYEDYNTYLTTTHTNIFDWFSVYAIYGMGYYGLPTQPVVTSAADLAALNARASERTDAAAVSTPLTAVEASLHSITEDRRMNLSIEIPEPVQRTNEKGEALLEIPGGSDFTRDYFAPRLPVIQKTYIFPAGSNVNSVSLKSSVERAVLGPMQLQKLVPVDKTNGSHEGSFEFDGPYPAERFAWAEKES